MADAEGLRPLRGGWKSC